MVTPEQEASQPIASEDKNPQVFVQTSVHQQVKGVSALSLQSIEMKKEAAQIRESKEEVFTELPTEPFTYNQFIQKWNSYVEELNKRGYKIQASNLNVNPPELKGTTIHLQVPSEISKEEIIAQKAHLLKYLHKQLRNFSIDLEVEVKAEVFVQRYAFTPQDKFEKLRDENPLIEDFVEAFSLEF